MYICAVDVGTTGTKTMIFDENGEKCAFAYQTYPLLTLPGNKIEQRAEDWWETTVTTIRNCASQIADPEQIAAISLSTQGGALVVTSSNGTPIGHAISWMDSSRGIPYIDKLLEWQSDHWFYEKSGWKLNSSMYAAKLLWLKENHPAYFKNGNHILSTIDYLNFKLTGQYLIDPSNAAMTQIFNFKDNTWNRELLAFLDVDPALFAGVVPTGQVIGHLSPEALKECGLNGLVQLISGGHDQYCAAVGAGAIHPGDVMLSTGTAWAALGIDHDIPFDEVGYPGIGRHIADNLMGRMFTVAAGGAGLDWARAKLFPTCVSGKISYAQLDQELIRHRESAADLIFYPHFLGIDYPQWNQAAKASFMGLSLDNDAYDISLAVMEGIVFQIAYGLEHDQSNGFETKSIKLLGGAANSGLWKQIISAVLNRPVTIFNETNMACVGAAIIAGKELGLFSTYEEGVNRMVDQTILPLPSDEWRSFYTAKYQKFKNGFRQINQYYHDLQEELHEGLCQAH